MVKTVVVTLNGTIPDTALSVDATVMVNGVSYAGKITGIITHESLVQPTTTVTLKGAGLMVTDISTAVQT